MVIIRDMRHVVNGERRSRASKVLTGASDRDAIRTNGETIGAPSRRIEELNAAISGHWTPSSEANARIVPLLLPIRRNVASGTSVIGTKRTWRDVRSLVAIGGKAEVARTSPNRRD